MAKKYLAPSVKKAFDILKVISSSKEGIGMNEIAKKLNIAKSTVHGIASILEDVGAVTRDPFTKRYELGLTLFELGRRAYSQVDLREIARPVMEELMEKVQETVFLGTLNGDRESILVLDVVECGHDLKITSPIGTTLSIFAAAPGKIFLATLEENDTLEIINRKGLPKYTDKSITDTQKFLEEIRNVREKGYATDYEEYISGVRAVAAPIHEEKHRLAAIYVVGFKASLNEEKMGMLKREVMDAAQRIDRKLRERLR